MKETRWLWIDGQQSGPFTVDRLYRMAKSEEIGPETPFWSDRQQQWKPLTGLMFDIEPTNLTRMLDVGITKAKIIDSGTGEDCPICHDLTGRAYPIESVPPLPPSGCTCVPWCRCMVVAAADE